MITGLFKALRNLLINARNYKKSFEYERRTISNQYAFLNTNGGRTGHEIAQLITSYNNLQVKIREVEFNEESSCYIPPEKCIYLSPHKYTHSDYQSVAIAAHECGHAWMHLKQKFRYYYLEFGKFMRHAATGLVGMDAISIFIYVISNDRRWLLASQIFPLLVLLSIPLNAVGNYYKELVEKEASNIGLDFLVQMKLILASEKEGIKQIFKYSLLSYQKGSFKSWITLFLVNILATISVIVILLSRGLLMQS